MKRAVLAFISISILSLITSCGSSTNGGKVVFNAASLPNVAVEREQKATINGHEFIYYNVYRSENDEFVLKDNSSFILNYDIVFGLSFSNSNSPACCYDVSEGTKDPKPIEPFDSNSYSIENYGFEISINKLISMQYNDVNIGKITHWC